jgi:hypothetical protein
MDRMLRAEIIATVRQTLKDVLEGAEEVWLTKEQMVERFGMFSEEWMRKNAQLLPREYASVIWPDGKEKCTRWAYPQHKRQRLIREGKLKGIKRNKPDSYVTGVVAAIQ